MSLKFQVFYEFCKDMQLFPEIEISKFCLIEPLGLLDLCWNSSVWLVTSTVTSLHPSRKLNDLLRELLFIWIDFSLFTFSKWCAFIISDENLSTSQMPIPLVFIL